MNTPKKISIIIPIFNMGEYLPACLDSVLEQTMKEIEVLCINDGSTDNSIEVLKKYAKDDERIKIVDRENWGVGKTRNQGIQLATGDYVCFMDPDDLYPSPDILESLYNGAITHETLICGGEFSQFSNESPELQQDFGKAHQGYLFDKEGIINYRDYQFDYGYHRFVYKRQWLLDNDIYFPPYARFQDPPFFVKAMITAGKFYAIDKIVYAYRVSHKVLQWNATKANDMLCGMLDLLNYANMYNLEKLRYYTGLRLSYNYSRSKGKYDTQCLTTLIKLCRAYVRFSTRHKLFSIKRLWNSKVWLVTIFGKSFIWDRT